MVQNDVILSPYTTISTPYNLVSGSVNAGVSFSDNVGSMTVFCIKCKFIKVQ